MSSPTFVSATYTGTWNNTGTGTVFNITVQGGDLILAFGGDSGFNTTTSWSAAWNGTPMSQIFAVGKSPSYCGLRAFQLIAPASGTFNCTMTQTPSGSTFGFCVWVWRNAKVGNWTAPVYTTSSASALSFPFTTNYNGSGVIFIADDFDNASGAGRTLFTGYTEDFFEYDTTDGYTIGGVHNPNLGNAGTYTVGYNTGWTSGHGTLGAIEVAYASPTAPCGFMQTYAMR